MSHRIAIVEDQPDERRVLKSRLTDRGFTVDAYGDRSRARADFLSGLVPDLAVLDINLNRNDPTDRGGFDLCREMGGIPATARVPVIFLTGIEDHQTELHGLTLAHDYVRKPIPVSLLVARIHNLLDWNRRLRDDSSGGSGGSSEDYPVIECGELRVDRNSNRAPWKGEDLKLTYNEFEILHALAEKRGNVAFYDDLFLLLGTHEISKNTIATHIKNIRRKFKNIDEDLPPGGVIESVPGIGYRWKTPPDNEDEDS